MVSDAMGNHLAVGLGAELDARGFQLGAQCRVVFYDAIVNDSDLVTRSVGMSIAFAWCAVGGPPCVGDSYITAQVTFVERIL